MRRDVVIGAIVTAAVAGWLWFWPSALGGQTSYVTTHGISMEPEFHTGDLAVIRPAASYAVGDVVAYRSALLHTVVMHRIVAVQDGLYTFKGDNNAWLDPEHPAVGDLVGKLALHVPQGGTWLDWFGNPLMVGLGLFALLATGGTVARTRRRRTRQQRRSSMSRHTTIRPASRSEESRAEESRPARTTARRILAVRSRAVAASAIVLGAVGLGLGAWSWGGPLDQTPAGAQPGPARMTFSYAAAVPTTPAYDSTTASSPDPVFRKLANVVDVHYAYQGDPGTVAVTANLSTANGWHSSLPLSAPTSFTGGAYEGSAKLDLQALDGRAQAAATATGIPAGTVSVAVTVRVDSASGRPFQPALKLNLTPMQLSLVGETKDLTVVDADGARAAAATPRTLGANGWSITAASARTVSIVLLVAALLGAAAWVYVVRRRGGDNEGAAIRRRYSSMLVPVRPVTTAPGRPVIDVATFAALAKLAERYGLLVLHWTRSGIETFIVQDESSTYRYRVGSQDPQPEAPEALTASAGGGIPAGSDNP